MRLHGDHPYLGAHRRLADWWITLAKHCTDSSTPAYTRVFFKRYTEPSLEPRPLLSPQRWVCCITSRPGYALASSLAH